MTPSQIVVHCQDCKKEIPVADINSGEATCYENVNKNGFSGVCKKCHADYEDKMRKGPPPEFYEKG